MRGLNPWIQVRFIPRYFLAIKTNTYSIFAKVFFKLGIFPLIAG